MIRFNWVKDLVDEILTLIKVWGHSILLIVEWVRKKIRPLQRNVLRWLILSWSKNVNWLRHHHWILFNIGKYSILRLELGIDWLWYEHILVLIEDIVVILCQEVRHESLLLHTLADIHWLNLLLVRKTMS